jgi:hypothetical protein
MAASSIVRSVGPMGRTESMECHDDDSLFVIDDLDLEEDASGYDVEDEAMAETEPLQVRVAEISE